MALRLTQAVQAYFDDLGKPVPTAFEQFLFDDGVTTTPPRTKEQSITNLRAATRAVAQDLTNAELGRAFKNFLVAKEDEILSEGYGPRVLSGFAVVLQDFITNIALYNR